jgi:hypothetical protein
MIIIIIQSFTLSTPDPHPHHPPVTLPISFAASRPCGGVLPSLPGASPPSQSRTTRHSCILASNSGEGTSSPGLNFF